MGTTSPWRCWAKLVVAAVAISMLGADRLALAIEPKGPLRQRMVFGPPHVPATADRYAHVPPGHERYQAVPVPAYPWLNNGFEIPTYQWGYFGARTRPRVVDQQGYYGDYRQWSFRPGL